MAMQGLTAFNTEMSHEFDYTEMVESLISHVWPTRRGRLNHDMLVNNFVLLFQTIWKPVQIIVVLHGLHEAGRNWDNIESTHKLFAPSYAIYAMVIATYAFSFFYSVKVAYREMTSVAVKSFREVSPSLRIVYHFIPVPVHSLGFFVFYSIVACHLNNAHRGDALCQWMNVRVITAIVGLGVGIEMLHVLFNFYQIDMHTQEPKKRCLRRTAGGGGGSRGGGDGIGGVGSGAAASAPLLGGSRQYSTSGNGGGNNDPTDYSVLSYNSAYP